ncbi:hypothetical protein [Flavobacterium sp. 22076]|jgi:hypothetical protein
MQITPSKLPVNYFKKKYNSKKPDDKQITIRLDIFYKGNALEVLKAVIS